MESEGFVVCDSKWNRIKVKSPQYVAISLLREFKNETQERRLLQIIITNEESEFLSYYPNYVTSYKELKKKFDAMCQQIEETFESLKREKREKEMKDSVFSSILYSMANKKKTAKKVFSDLDVKKAQVLLKQFDEGSK